MSSAQQTIFYLSYLDKKLPNPFKS